MKKISVIVPIYKSEEYLEYCIRSILNQTYPNLEIILVDDGSPDRCPEMCDRFKMIDDRIIVIHKENGGLSDARNSGMRVASGDFLLFIDSDDMIDEKFCEIAVDAMSKYDAQIISFDMTLFFSYGEFNSNSVKLQEYKESVYKNQEIIQEYLVPKSDRVIYHGLCMKMYKKELFEGLWFDKGRLHEDVFITYKIMHRCNVLVAIAAPLYFYYQNPQSICHNYRSKNFLDEYDALNEMEEYFCKDKQLKPYVVKFMIYEYRYMILQGYTNADLEVKEKINIIYDWVKTNIHYCKIPFLKKIVLLLEFRFPKIYVYFKGK